MATPSVPASSVPGSSLPANGEISGAVLLYTRPEPLSLELHQQLKIARSDTPYGFARNAHIVPIQVTEFGPASLSYPLIFAGSTYQPMAVLSIRPDESLFIDEAGAFEPNAYTPAYIRRFPFVLASNEAEGQLIVCVDRAAPMLTTGGGIALFENGQPTEFTQQAIQFCSDFETERLRTESFVKTLRELDLFESKQAMVTPIDPDGTTGTPVQVADYFAVSEEKLNALDADRLVQLRASGALQQIYCHLNSLLNWDRLIAKTLARYPNGAAPNA